MFYIRIRNFYNSRSYSYIKENHPYDELKHSFLSLKIFIITLSYVIMIFGLLFTNMNVFASLSSNSSEELMQPQQQQHTSSNNGTIAATATDIYNMEELVLGSDVKDLVILIPNEGHHGPGEDNEARFIAQSFVPETAVINKGTNVIWFNGDVGHEHDIVVTPDSGSSSPIYQTGEFSEFEARNYTFNEEGQFQYADTVEYDNGYIMRGNISVFDEGQDEFISQTLALHLVY
jgi:plastocyanin